MFLKVCGITRADDAAQAVEAGATALGFVFWDRSPRRVSPDVAAAILASVPASVVTVGVFVNESVDVVRRIVVDTGIGAVQLHGDESEDVLAGLRGPVIRSVAVDDTFDPDVLAAWRVGVVPLLDAADPVRRGGTGTRVDWALASRAARMRPIVLAGGLTPENAGDAIRLVRPAAVDVSSGIEDEPGRKNAEKMAAFARAVRLADGMA